MKDLLLLAASGLAREVAAAKQRDYRVVGILDDDDSLHGKRIAGVDVLGGITLAVAHDAQLLICVGSGTGRRKVAGRLRALGVPEDRFATMVDESARVPPSCDIGPGSILLANVVLTTEVTVGKHVVVMPNVTLTHDVAVGDYATLTAGVSLAGGVVVGEESYIGMNASVRQNVWIGLGSVLGMGAVALSDIPAGETWAGVPARPLSVTPESPLAPDNASIKRSAS